MDWVRFPVWTFPRVTFPRTEKLYKFFYGFFNYAFSRKRYVRDSFHRELYDSPKFHLPANNFPDDHFPAYHFPVDHFPEYTFPLVTFLRTELLKKMGFSNYAFSRCWNFNKNTISRIVSEWISTRSLNE
jgi:hypothetical protein